MSYQENPKKPQDFICENCDFITCNKKDYIRHLSTQKHKKRVNSYQIVTDSYQKTPENPRPFQCDCGKTYKHKQNLYSHRKKCDFENEEKNFEKNSEEGKIKNKEILSVENNSEFNNDLDYKKMFLEMMQQNKELHNTICELIPKVGNTVVNNTNSNNTNNNINNLEKIIKIVDNSFIKKNKSKLFFNNVECLDYMINNYGHYDKSTINNILYDIATNYYHIDENIIDWIINNYNNFIKNNSGQRTCLLLGHSELETRCIKI